MSELTEWLRARLDEDEAEVGPFPPYPGARDESAGPNGIGWAEVGGISEVLMIGHRRVLAEVEARRAIVALHSAYEFPQVMTYGTIIACSECGSVDDSPQEWPCPTLRLLAQPYASHAGFRPEWRVDGREEVQG